MNTYQSMYENGNVNKDTLLSGVNNFASWEDGYWIAKILTSFDIPEVSDQKLIEIIEDTFFMGLSLSNKELFFDANETLIKLYIRYGRYDEAASKLLLLTCNYECPDWVHLYLAMAELQCSTKERLIGDPDLFFDELLKVDFNDASSRKEIKNIFGKYLYFIMEQAPNFEDVPLHDIIKFAENIKYTASDEFRVFHQNVCPELEYEVTVDEPELPEDNKTSAESNMDQINDLQEKLKQSEAAHRVTQEKLVKEELQRGAIEEALDNSLRENTKIQEALKKVSEEQKDTKATLVKTKKENEKTQEKLSISESDKKVIEKKLQQEKQAHTETQKQLEASKTETELIKSQLEQEKNEKSEMAIRLQELEQAKQTEMHPESIDDVFLKMTGWLNVTVRRYLAQWLSTKLLQICGDNYWHDNVWKALGTKEKDKFNTYKELSDFAFDALLSIYYYNFDLFYTYSSKAKSDDRDRVKEMQQIRNRWIGHFEENSWTKEKILFDIDTIIGFLGQISMPNNMRTEFREYRTAVAKMK